MSTTETRLAFSDVKRQWHGACGGDSATRTEVLWIPVGGRVSGLRPNTHRRTWQFSHKGMSHCNTTVMGVMRLSVCQAGASGARMMLGG